MSRAIEWVVDIMIVTFIVVFVVSAINVGSTIRQAEAFHNLAIAEVEASNFDEGVIKKYAEGRVNEHYLTTFTNVSAVTDSSSTAASERIYLVKTTYKISIPILGYSKTNVISGYAR